METGRKIPFDWDNFPLEISTDSVDGSDDVLKVHFFDKKKILAGWLFIIFTAPSFRFKIEDCFNEAMALPTNPPTHVNKTWKITKMTNPHGIAVDCNGKRIVHFLMSDCSFRGWKSRWGKDVEFVAFYLPDVSKNRGLAADFYRAAESKCCESLNVSAIDKSAPEP